MTRPLPEDDINIKQQHSGAGDNVGRDKNIWIKISNWFGLIVVIGLIIVTLIYVHNKNKKIDEENQLKVADARKTDSLNVEKAKLIIQSSYSTKYLSITGNEIDLLLDSNKLSGSEIIEIVGPRPSLLTTPIVEQLRKIKDEFGISLPKYVLLENNQKIVTSFKRLAKNRKIAYLKDKILPTTNPNMFSQYSFGIFAPLKYEAIFPSNLIPETKFATTADVDLILKASELFDYQRAYLSVYRYFAGKAFPPKFIILHSYSEECGGDRMTFSTPILKVRIMYIKNVSTTSIRLTHFVFRTNPVDTLRGINYDLALMNFGNIDSANYHITLLPGRTLVIPLYAYFETVDKIKTEEIEINTKSRDTSKQFVAGTSSSIDSIEVNESRFAVNKDYNAKEYGLFVNGMSEGGSCPYVFTFSNLDKKFVLEKHILYGRNTLSKQGWDTITLKRFNGTLELRELDPETSYIDCIKILEVDKKGNQRILYPEDKRLLLRDKEQLILHRGDVKVVNFEGFRKLAAKYYVISYGYYLPYLQSSKKRQLPSN